MILELVLACTAALAWSMVVWHVGQRWLWTAGQRRLTFWAGCILLTMLILSLVRR